MRAGLTSEVAVSMGTLMTQCHGYHTGACHTMKVGRKGGLTMNGKRAKRLRREAREVQEAANTVEPEHSHGVRRWGHKLPGPNGGMGRVEMSPGSLRAIYQWLKGRRDTGGI